MIKIPRSGIPSLPDNGFVTLGKLLKLHVLQFLHLYSGNNSKIYLKGFCEELHGSSQNKTWHVEDAG